MDALSLRRLILLALFSLVLISCGTQPVAPPPPAEPDRLAVSAEAEAALAGGDIAGAAMWLEVAADDAASPEREGLLLSAAALWLDLGQPLEAAALLQRLDPAALDPELQYRHELLQIRLLLANDLAAAASQRLFSLSEPPPALRTDWLRTRAEALSADGRLMAAAQARAELDPLLGWPIQQELNQRELWRLLTETPMDALRLRMPPPPDEFGGWLELAFLVRSHRLNLAELENEVALWRQRYPDHAAIPTLLPELMGHYRENLRAPQHIAVLLPLSGELAGAAEAVLDGLTASYYASAERPRLRVYDVGESGEDAISSYRRATAAGADFVIGPLTKESLIALSSGLPELPVPVLALNTLPTDYPAPRGLYQFALAPEDEARAAAGYALAAGHRAAVALVPRGDWGGRLAEAFQAAFEAGGGRVLETAEYDSRAADFSQPIRQMFNLDASDRRYRELRGALRLNLQFEPYRRQDVDLVFVGASPREARLIRPQLRFFHAMELPVVATSHIYSGVPSEADHDLNGMEFVDMPWVLHPGAHPELSRESLRQLQPSAAELPRLYAFGVDAWRLIPYLQVLGAAPGQESLDGTTGVLVLGEDGRVHRRLFGARFVGGRVSIDKIPEQAFGAPRDEPAAW